MSQGHLKNSRIMLHEEWSSTQYLVSKARNSLYAQVFQIGLEGEHLNIYKADGFNNVNWLSTSEAPKNQPLTWYKVNSSRGFLHHA